MPKKTKEPLDDMEEKKPLKKSEGKDKNWKNHLLDGEEQEEDFDDASFEEFKDFDDSMSTEDDEDDDF